MSDRLQMILASAGARLASDLAERLVPHRGEQGAAREEVIRTFLRAHLPLAFEVGTGFAFDASGAVSNQLDVIIANTTVAPRFEVVGGARFYPCEAIVAVGQIKTHVSSRRELMDALTNLRSVTKLDRTAGGLATCTASGELLSPSGNHLDRVFTFLFVTDRALDGKYVQEIVAEEVVPHDPAEAWPNMIVALNHYIVTFACEHGVCPNTLDARGIALVEATSVSDRLAVFYAFLAQAVSATRVARMQPWAHLHGSVPCSASVIYAAVTEGDELPPRLCSLVR